MARLFLIPTPIGNLEDITLRALRTIRETDILLAEDTRKTSILLNHHGVNRKTFSCHQHNEKQMLPRVLTWLEEGKTVGLISDAGTPGISDPGYLLVHHAIENGHEVECLPGPTALIPALVNSGFPSDHFLFCGFLPQKKGRQTRIRELAQVPYTLILYESPHRLVRTLEALATEMGAERKACVCRELTKIYEEKNRGTLESLLHHYQTRQVKGEIVIIIEGKII
ncbi:MAG: 16S rRNA (cytidine(1402)-2'-O)-methyltransferase [Bacteroidetes bacterium]|nr:16S rRNA (cytidine(1402)-2'-O)-methyltransferase [Bacteroidota bacterium]